MMATDLPREVHQLIELALEEDLGTGDVTAEYFTPKSRRAYGQIVCRQKGIFSGGAVAKEVFRRVDSGLNVEVKIQDGALIQPSDVLIEIKGSARSILTAERTALNFLQRLSGIATKTRRFVELVEGTSARILDTRKTTPGWRWLEKYAVRTGGGTNHRMGLYDRAMVKDNHLISESGISELTSAIFRLKSEKKNVEVELEADHMHQVRDFLDIEGVDYLLLDNMSLEQLKEAINLRNQRREKTGQAPQLEASGGVNLETVADIAKTGVDFISVGALTHSAVALDLAMDFHEFVEE